MQRTRIGWLVPVALLGVPLIEVALFILVGNQIGLWATIGLIIATAIAGSLLIRLQGVSILRQAQVKLDRGEPPVADMFHALGLLIAGVMLLTPGFLTDTIGFLLLVPPVRTAIGAFVWERFQAQQGGPGQSGPVRDDVIEGEFSRVDPEADGASRPSGVDRPLPPGQREPGADDSPWRRD